MRMHKTALLALLLLPIFSVAQNTPEVPKAEVFAGYSTLWMDMEAPAGWNASVTGNLKPWLGVTADFSGHYGGDEMMTMFFPGTTAERKIHSVMFGPRFTYRRERFSPFVHTLFGFARENTTFSGSNVAETNFALALGGGLDMKLNRRFGLRLFQADYHGNQLTGGMQHHIRLGAGVTFRLGTK